MNIRTLYEGTKKLNPKRVSNPNPVGEPSEVVEVLPNLKNNTIVFVLESAGVTEATNHLSFIEFRNTKFIPDEEFTGDENQYYSVAHEGKLYWVKKHRTTNTVRVNCSCFTGDTEVLLADGSTKTFEELSQLDTFEIITHDGTGFKRAQAGNCFIRQWNVPIIELTFEDNSKIKCTPDHIFFLADYLTKCQAKDLLNKNVGTNNGMLKVINIRELENSDVYCLTVPDIGRFCLANGCLVQNCSDQYFTFAYPNWKKGVGYGKKPLEYRRKTPPPPIGRKYRNPYNYVGCCKHIQELITQLFELDVLEDRIR